MGRYKANTAGDIAAPLTALGGCSACPAGTTTVSSSSTTLSACSLCLPGYYYNSLPPPTPAPSPAPAAPTLQPTTSPITGYALARRYSTADCSGQASAEYLFVFASQCMGLVAGYDAQGQILYRYVRQALAALSPDGSSATLHTLNFSDSACVIASGSSVPSNETLVLNSCHRSTATRFAVKYTAVSRTALAFTLVPALVLTYFPSPDACVAHSLALALGASATDVLIQASHRAAINPGQCVFYSPAFDSGAGDGNDGLYFSIPSAPGCSQMPGGDAEFVINWYNNPTCSTSLDGQIAPTVSEAVSSTNPSAPGIIGHCFPAWQDASAAPVNIRFSCAAHAPTARPTAGPTVTPAARACLPCPADSYTRHLAPYNPPACVPCPVGRYTPPATLANTACLNYLNSLSSFTSTSTSTNSASSGGGGCIFPAPTCVHTAPYAPTDAVRAGLAVPSLRVEGSFFQPSLQGGQFNVTTQV